ncbi:MAG: tyrosine-type recombinase/integrase [Pirellulaceae bacterium]
MERRGKINRIYVNDQVAIIQRMFQWGVAQELVSVSIHQALLTVESLHKGRDTRVTERRKVLPAPDPHVDAVIAIAPPQIAAMIELQRLTGMRPDEVTIMRPCDIDRTSEIWLYQPQDHKMDHLDIDKVVLLGPRAQKILEPWLKRPPTEYLFSPAAVCKAAWDKRRKRLNPKPRKRKSKGGKPRRPREHYDDESYCRRVKRLCEQAGVPKWTPHQLRHSAATEIRRKHGLEAARLILGHRSAATTEIYAEKELHEAIRIMQEIG